MRFFTVAAFLCGLISTAGASTNESASKRLVLPSDFTPPPVFKNINLLKNINLEKGYVRESVNVVIENVDKKDQDEYYIAFSTEHFSKVGGLEVHNKNAPEEGKFEVIKPEINPSSPVQYFIARLPKPLTPSKQFTLNISYYILGVLTPLPAAVNQAEPQYLAYVFSAYALSAYITDTQKTRVKYPNSNVPDYTKTSGLKSGPDPQVQGSAHIYGPYKTSDAAPGRLEPVAIRYEYTRPIITCSLLERDLEVSHWGGNLATEDRFWLRNDGVELSEPFDRVTWTIQAYQGLPSHALNHLRVTLNRGSTDPYYIDDIGNVSTSRFRPSARQDASLELKTRYPIFGGWKYSFKIGWNDNLNSFLRNIKGDSYVLKVPFLQGPRNMEGIQYEKIITRIILPEGSTDVKYELADGTGMPFEVQSNIGLHKTFMDTIGRTVLTLETTNVAESARSGRIIITYNYPFPAMLRKPLTISAGFFTLLVTIYLLGKVDVGIKKR